MQYKRCIYQNTKDKHLTTTVQMVQKKKWKEDNGIMEVWSNGSGGLEASIGRNRLILAIHLW